MVKKKIGLNSLNVTENTFADNSDDSDFEDKPIRASPTKRSSKKDRTKPRSSKRSSSSKKKKRTGNAYGSDELDDDDDDLSIGSGWSITRETTPPEMSANGRPVRRSVKGKTTYQEPDTDESEEARSSSDEDSENQTPVPKKRRSGGKAPAKTGGKKPQTPAPRRGGRAKHAISDDDEDEEDEEEEVEAEESEDDPQPALQRPKGKLIIKLKVPLSTLPRRATRSTIDDSDPLIAFSSSGKHIQEVKREPTMSPKARGSRSRSRSVANRPSIGGKGPAGKGVSHSAAAAAPRRATRASSRAASVPPEEAVVVDEDEHMTGADDDPTLSKITEVPSSTNGLSQVEILAAKSNGSLSGTGGKTDDTFHPAESTSNGPESLELPVGRRDTQGLLEPNLPEGEPGKRQTRASVAALDEDEDDEDDIAEQQQDLDDDDEEGPVSRPRRNTRAASKPSPSHGSTTGGKSKKRTATRNADESSEFEAEEDDEDDDDASESDKGSPKKSGAFIVDDDGDEDSGSARRRTRNMGKRKRMDESEGEDLHSEVRELQPKPKKPRTRGGAMVAHDSQQSLTSGERTFRKRGQPVDYRVWRPEQLKDDGASPPPGASPHRGRRGGPSQNLARSLFNTQGPFGGAGQGPALFGNGGGGAGKPAAMDGYDSDSSDDDQAMPTGGGGGAGRPSLGPGLGKQGSIAGKGGVGAVGAGGTPANLGRVTAKSKQLLADTDPLGVDPNVDFTAVGGLEDHINQLKEMVSLPLLYPEIFQNLKVTPPRGVLFHGPPGTGKTLLARALAASCSTEGRKISFYMRKGADVLSKWVGEAERQLRLLFEEARNNQPSIIFFDEIDGLAPVRSSKQEQIHASIVSTLLALMDGMDGRGQVIVIGATNRPDSIDPALRRPGRFDREFYFPLPDKKARKAIIDIHTGGWQPGLKEDFKIELSGLTKGYGGADLRALCTEAALNAVQRKYPQIYKETTKKFIIDPKSIDVTAKDFMISIQKIVPSSERSTTSGAAPLPEHIVPLLGNTLTKIKDKLFGILPDKKRLTALEEAEFEDYNDADGGFGRERMLRDFESSRVFKPRLLVHGQAGMGQGYLGGAVLHHFEGFHVQTINLPILMGDPAKTPEVVLIQIFVELKRHKPSVLYIPDFENWYDAVSNELIKTFTHLLNSISPSEPILLFAMTSTDVKHLDVGMLKDFFGYSRKCRVAIERPDAEQRHQYFANAIGHIRKTPKDFPDPVNRPKRVLEILQEAPPPPPKPITAEEIAEDRRNEQYLRHLLKVRLMPMMEMMKQKYKRFRKPFVAEDRLLPLFPPEPDPDVVVSDIPVNSDDLDVAIVYDKEGEAMVLDKIKGLAFYNLDLEQIESRVFNGFYVHPQGFLKDIRLLSIDCQKTHDRATNLQGSEMLTNAEIGIVDIESAEPALMAQLNLALEKREARRLRRIARQEEERRAANPEHMPGVEGQRVDWVGFGEPSAPLNSRRMVPPQTPMQRQRQMMEPVTEERSNVSNGYIAGSELDNVPEKSVNDSDGDLVMGDANNLEQSPGGGSQTSMMVNTSHRFVFTAGQNTIRGQQGLETQFAAAATAAGSQTQPQTQNATQRSGTQNFSSVGLMSTQRQFEQYTGDASTTTSGKKTTDESVRASGGSTQRTGNPHNLEESPLLINATPNISFGTPVIGDSQLVDTQRVASSEESSQSQANQHGGQFHIPHPRHLYTSSQSQNTASPLLAPPLQRQEANLQSQNPSQPQNHPTTQNQNQQAVILRPRSPPHPAFELDETNLDNFHAKVVEITNDMSVEQLEQVNASLMDHIWSKRGEWDRNDIVVDAEEVLKEVVEDIREMEGLGRVEEEEA